jgi:hypothetical protein
LPKHRGGWGLEAIQAHVAAGLPMLPLRGNSTFTCDNNITWYVT